MKILLSSTMIMGFILSVGAVQGIEPSSASQPITPLTEQAQLIQVRWHPREERTSSHRHHIKHSGSHHRERKEEHQKRTSHHFKHHGARQQQTSVEQKALHHHHFKHHGTRQQKTSVEQKALQHHHLKRHGIHQKAGKALGTQKRTRHHFRHPRGRSQKNR